MKNTAYSLIIAIAIVFLLIMGRDLLIPFVFAFLLWFIVKQIRGLMDKIPFLKKYLPSWFKNIVSLLVILSILHSLITIVVANITLLARSYRNYEANLEILLHNINERFDLDILESIRNYILDIDVGAIIVSVLNYSTDFLGSTVMVIIYALFIFLEETSFKKKTEKLFQSEHGFNNFYATILRIESAISRYLGMKTLISFTTALVSYIILLFIGVDYPVFWAFLIFLLNFIPAIGSMVATLFPVFFSFLQFGSFGPGFLVLILVGSVQFLVGNILDPRLMGNSVNLSPLVIIISLSFWGAVWGVTGMLLSVPIMVILVIIFSQFQETKPFAILLSGNGEIEHVAGEEPVSQK